MEIFHQNENATIILFIHVFDELIRSSFGISFFYSFLKKIFHNFRS